jgi:hypothetical protein
MQERDAYRGKTCSNTKTPGKIPHLIFFVPFLLNTLNIFITYELEIVGKRQGAHPEENNKGSRLHFQISAFDTSALYLSYITHHTRRQTKREKEEKKHSRQTEWKESKYSSYIPPSYRCLYKKEELVRHLAQQRRIISPINLIYYKNLWILH